MRKLIEDLHISVSEKDAEIIKLKMSLTDERQKLHQQSRKQLTPIKPDTREWEQQIAMLRQENEVLLRQMEEDGKTHKQEIDGISERFKQQLVEAQEINKAQE
jgi:hypothetical protein